MDNNRLFVAGLCVQLRDKEIDFFPLNHALCLATTEDDNREQLDELKAMVQRLLDRVEKEVRKDL